MTPYRLAQGVAQTGLRSAGGIQNGLIAHQPGQSGFNGLRPGFAARQVGVEQIGHGIGVDSAVPSQKGAVDIQPKHMIAVRKFGRQEAGFTAGFHTLLAAVKNPLGISVLVIPAPRKNTQDQDFGGGMTGA